jgi:hypothetical protein
MKNLLLYNGSTDERNQRIYDKAGYGGYLFLVFGLFVDLVVKMVLFKAAWDQVLPELTLLVLSLVVTTVLLVYLGATGFENLRQKKTLRTFILSFSFVVITGLGITALWFKLPQGAWMWGGGPLVWLIPPFLGLVVAAVFWFLIELLSLVMNRRAEKIQK